MTDEGKTILVSGVKPTAGQVHIGNYFGAMKQFVELQEQYDSRIFVADFHAMTSVQDADLLRESTYGIVCDYLAIGLDPAHTTLYVQSRVPQVTELTWIFNCLTTVPYLQRAHAYKDAEAKGEEINAGTFDYPVLMAADILIQDAGVVPVGSDQKQHLEITRDIADKFNTTYEDTFTLPEPYILETTQTVPGTDGRKMSKSYGNTIPLFATDEEIDRAVKSIPTDSTPVEEPKDADADIVFQLHQLFAKSDDELAEIRSGYEKGGLSYKESKDLLTTNIINFIQPLRERRTQIAADTEYVEGVIEEGSRKAHERAERKMEHVRSATGLA